MKYTTERLKSCTGFSVGSYSIYDNKDSFQIHKEGKALEAKDIGSELQKLEQKLLDTVEELSDANQKLNLAQFKEDLLLHLSQ